MTALDEGRRPFIDTARPSVTRASARLHDSGDYRAAIVDLGETRMHVHTAAQAREIAAAFASAAALLANAEETEQEALS